ncbi:hypothetical protein OXYTRIMIC_549 [Oxytricha trifallax]|uniref:Uncharacterized protein n=1 Tax=Oxytricha trifallax TaxID=1172189 RepID=A0A073IAF3_9SPIT|nr:hypothetical protein OXYTRIMIC_549 [Oxytricha trifallax]
MMCFYAEVVLRLQVTALNGDLPQTVIQSRITRNTLPVLVASSSDNIGQVPPVGSPLGMEAGEEQSEDIDVCILDYQTFTIVNIAWLPQRISGLSSMIR